MESIRLTVAIDENPRTAALFSGQFRTEGLELAISTALRGPALFRHQLQTREFDVSDMSMTTVYMMASRGDDSFLALPVFTMRHFFHTTALVRADAGISRPEDLVGKRIGIPGYQSAASLWCRAALRHEFGVNEFDVEWFTERMAEAGSGEVAFVPPEGLKLRSLPEGRSVFDLLREGELDAVVNALHPPEDLLKDGSGIVRLFAYPLEEDIRYYQSRGIYPVNHCLVMNRAVVNAHPQSPALVYAAFARANEQSCISHQVLFPYVETGLISPEAAKALSRNLFDYGIEAASTVLHAFGQYCFEQGYTTRPLAPAEVFTDPSAR